MRLFETEHYRIGLDPEIPCIEWIGLKNLNSKIFRESEHKMVEWYHKHRKKYPNLQLYVDARVVGYISTEDTTWVADEIIPGLAEAGLGKEAFLVSENALDKLIVKNYISKAGHIIEMKVFASELDAKNWLKE